MSLHLLTLQVQDYRRYNFQSGCTSWDGRYHHLLTLHWQVQGHRRYHFQGGGMSWHWGRIGRRLSPILRPTGLRLRTIHHRCRQRIPFRGIPTSRCPHHICQRVAVFAIFFGIGRAGTFSQLDIGGVAILTFPVVK
jgi:hypothetical protein